MSGGDSSNPRPLVRVGAQLQSRKAMLDTLMRHLSMVRLSVAMIAIVAAVGCVGTIETTGGGSALSPEEQVAQAAWLDKALPRLTTACGGCHMGEKANIGFLVGTSDLDKRATLMGFDPQVVNLDAVQSSRILTKGLHDGPALQAAEASDILEWLQAQHDAAGAGSGSAVVIETAHFLPLVCSGGAAGSDTCPINHVPLDALGASGATIDFVVQALSSGIYLNDIKIVAATDGVYLEHPLFVSYPDGADPKPDKIDRYFATKLDVMPTMSTDLEGGTAAFMGFSVTDKLAITFKVVDKYRADTGTGSGSDGTGGGATGGCKQLASFKTNAQVPLQQSCASCHGGGDPNAKAAMDLSNIGATDDPTILLACNQVHSRINLTDVENSGFFVAPNPAQATNHPFKFNNVQATYQAFHDAVVIWANAEKTSP